MKARVEEAKRQNQIDKCQELYEILDKQRQALRAAIDRQDIEVVRIEFLMKLCSEEHEKLTGKAL